MDWWPVAVARKFIVPIHDGGALVTGLSAVIYIQRLSDGYWWNAGSWQSGVASNAMSERTPSTPNGGTYEYTWNDSSATSEDHFMATVKYTDATTGWDFNWFSEFRTLKYTAGDIDNLSNLDVAVSTRLASADISLTGGRVDVGLIEGSDATNQINAEVSDVLKTDTVAELTTDAGATPTLEKAILLLYMALRNKTTTSDGTDGFVIHNNAGTGVLSADLDDDGTTFTQEKLADHP